MSKSSFEVNLKDAEDAALVHVFYNDIVREHSSANNNLVEIVEAVYEKNKRKSIYSRTKKRLESKYGNEWSSAVVAHFLNSVLTEVEEPQENYIYKTEAQNKTKSPKQRVNTNKTEASNVKKKTTRKRPLSRKRTLS